MSLEDGRTYISEGPVDVKVDGKQKKGYIFVTSDSVVICKLIDGEFHFLDKLVIDGLVVKDLTDNGKYTVGIHAEFPCGKVTYFGVVGRAVAAPTPSSPSSNNGWIDGKQYKVFGTNAYVWNQAKHLPLVAPGTYQGLRLEASETVSKPLPTVGKSAPVPLLEIDLDVKEDIYGKYFKHAGNSISLKLNLIVLAHVNFIGQDATKEDTVVYSILINPMPAPVTASTSTPSSSSSANLTYFRALRTTCRVYYFVQ